MNGFVDKSITAVLSNKRLIIRATLSILLLIGMVYIAHLLFFHKPDDAMKDMVNVMLGAILMAFSKIVDFWFKEHKEQEDKDSNDQ